jgi:hypothetical protein
MLRHARTRNRQSEWVLAVAISALAPWIVHAQTGPGLLLEPFPKEQFIDTRDGYLHLDAGHVKGTDESARLSFIESTGRVRVIPGNLISPRIGWDFEHIVVDAGDGPLDDFLPGQLTDHSLGVAFPVAKVKDWIFGISIGAGYAGGSPWGDGSGWYGKATAVAFRQFSDKDALVFVLDWDGNRTYLPDVPLPGAAYTRKVNDSLTYIVGFPLSSITWKPLPKTTIELGYLMIESFDAAAGYEFAPHWTVFGNLEYRDSAFSLDELNGNDRLIFQHRRAEVGVRWAPTRDRQSFAVTAAAGYAWGQEFSVGFDSRQTNEVADLGDVPYLRVGFELKF